MNLIHAAFHNLASAEEFLEHVFDELSRQRMEIDLIDLNGPEFEKWDRLKLPATLVTGSYSEAVVFPADGKLVAPNELLYKKALVLAPRGYEEMEELERDLIQVTLAGLPQEEVDQKRGALGLFCLVSAPLVPHEPPATAEHLARHAAELNQLGSGVMVFRARELYFMSAYVSRYTKARVHFAVGISDLISALRERYNDLDGALLEAVARLFTQNVRLSVHPMPVAALKRQLESFGTTGWSYKESNGMVYAEDLEPAEPLNHLYNYLLGKDYIFSVRPVLNFA